MRVVDANVVAAALIQPDGWTATQLRRGDVAWLAPAYLFEELDDHADAYGGKADVPLDIWEGRVARFREDVGTVDGTALVEAADHRLVGEAESVDPDDAVYLAALVTADADLLWTRDQALLDAFPDLAVQFVPGDS